MSALSSGNPFAIAALYTRVSKPMSGNLLQMIKNGFEESSEPLRKRPRLPKPVGYTGQYSIPCPKVSSGAQLGKQVILPASFGGSPRALHQSYLDAMAIVARFGRPDYFITMTANPNWAEIVRNLRPRDSCKSPRPRRASLQREITQSPP